jgi:PPM family protein phosphatase
MQPQDMRPMQIGPIVARVAARTDIGREREKNEDNHLVVDLSTAQRDADKITEVGLRGLALGVFDGMGGAAAGEVASQMAADIVNESLLKLAPDLTSREFARALRTTVERANDAIFAHGRSHTERKGMGTTCTLVAMRGTELFVGQVGDSRAYILRSEKLFRITKDQSLLGHLIEIGQVVSEHSKNAPASNLILQALGTKSRVKVDLSRVDVRRGDRLLLCSDGLHGHLSDDEMQKICIEFSDAEACAKRLVDLANEAGGLDNITVVVCDIGGKGLPFPRDSEVIGHRPYDPDSTGVFNAHSVAPAALPVPSPAQRDVPTDVYVLPVAKRPRSLKWAGLCLIALVLALGPLLWIDREDRAQASKQPTAVVQQHPKPAATDAVIPPPAPIEPTTAIEPEPPPSPTPSSAPEPKPPASLPRKERLPRRSQAAPKTEPSHSPPPASPPPASADWHEGSKVFADPF